MHRTSLVQIPCRYANDTQKQKLNRDFNNAGPGNVIRFPDGSTYEIVETVTQETPEQQATRLERKKQEKEQARARYSRYDKTEARKISKKAYEKTPGRKGNPHPS